MSGIRALTYTSSHLLHCPWDLYVSNLEVSSLKERIVDTETKIIRSGNSNVKYPLGQSQQASNM